MSKFFKYIHRLSIAFKVAVRLLNYTVLYKSDSGIVLVIWEHFPEGNAVKFYKEHILTGGNIYSEIIFYRRLSFRRILRNMIFKSNKLINNHKFEFAVFGENKGIHSQLIKNSLIFDKLVEVQHGALDESYFPIQSDIFVCRSSESCARVLDSTFTGILIQDVLDFDVSFEKSLRSLDSYSQYSFFSKNPGGGVSWANLARAESKIFNRLSKKNIYLNVHPRDNFLKFCIRHLCYSRFAKLRAFIKIYKTSTAAPKTFDNKLVIGLDTTAILDCCVIGDHVIDVNPSSRRVTSQSRINKHLQAYDLSFFDLQNIGLLEVGVVRACP